MLSYRYQTSVKQRVMFYPHSCCLFVCLSVACVYKQQGNRVTAYLTTFRKVDSGDMSQPITFVGDAGLFHVVLGSISQLRKLIGALGKPLATIIIIISCLSLVIINVIIISIVDATRLHSKLFQLILTHWLHLFWISNFIECIRPQFCIFYICDNSFNHRYCTLMNN